MGHETAHCAERRNEDNPEEQVCKLVSLVSYKGMGKRPVERKKGMSASLTVNCICRTAARFCYAGRCPRPWPPGGQIVQ